MERNIRILVVDDQEAMRRILRAELAELGYENVDTAVDGAWGLVKLREGRYDLVITDWNMPHMDGLSMLKAIRKEYSRQQLPVLMVTAEARRQNIVAAAVAGADGYIVKPFSLATLESKIAKILERREAGKTEDDTAFV
ncbi:response regulator [Cupriavidus respiraculi]|uniref:Chemotaxis protein CheY n=1 Tax=Cupriavidus respiraculi TaxID=195930 RepID=A0ABM8WIG1_9BURK|nr:response regulator [Cupriavidus respiraculi]MBY4948106.1 response regulator [Cupriavidus respiraculi]CAG9167167.1 Chemotaxis protein CheY [Cupriavidus respiraculi]